MKITHDKTAYDVTGSEEGADITVQIDGLEKKFTLRRSGDNAFRINSGRRPLTAYRAENKDKIFVQVEGELFVFDKKSSQNPSHAGEGVSADKEAVYAPMPGSVISVNVSPGDDVTDGDALIIVEAMKMETTLYSSIAGKIKEVNVSAGQQIDTDTILILIEKD